MTQIAQSFACVTLLHHSQMTHTPHNHLVACLANQTANHSWTSYLIVLLLYQLGTLVFLIHNQIVYHLSKSQLFQAEAPPNCFLFAHIGQMSQYHVFLLWLFFLFFNFIYFMSSTKYSMYSLYLKKPWSKVVPSNN